MMTFHPSGFTHGPHPKALESILAQKTATADEYAVMIDARDALDVDPVAATIELRLYADSWMTNAK
jgi:homogentisate 1,2-dioxygenase